MDNESCIPTFAGIMGEKQVVPTQRKQEPGRPRLKIVADPKETIEEIRVDQKPTSNTWKLLSLYKTSSKGGLMMWQVGFDGGDHLELTHGYVDGEIRTDRTQVEPKGGRNIGDQSLLEARQRYQLKYKEGYRPAGSLDPPIIKGMKGNVYKEGCIKHWPVATQAKLNGIRMLAQDDGSGKITTRSWFNNYYYHLGHITDKLSALFPYLPAHSTLDGELYNHDLDFTTLTSAVKTVKTVHPLLSQVQYHIFDIFYEGAGGFEERNQLLNNAYSRYEEDMAEREEGVQTVFYIIATGRANNHEEVMEQHQKMVEEGFEGIMIKKIAGKTDAQKAESLYKPGKRCNNILKYKDFHDEEVEVIGVEDAKGTEKGAAILLVKDERGNTFPLRMRGTFERRKDWLDNPDGIIGKNVTMRYQELSIYGVPRFPVGVAVRDYE